MAGLLFLVFGLWMLLDRALRCRAVANAVIAAVTVSAAGWHWRNRSARAGPELPSPMPHRKPPEAAPVTVPPAPDGRPMPRPAQPHFVLWICHCSDSKQYFRYA